MQEIQRPYMCIRDTSSTSDFVDDVIEYDRKYELYLIRWIIDENAKKSEYSWQRLSNMNDACKLYSINKFKVR